MKHHEAHHCTIFEISSCSLSFMSKYLSQHPALRYETIFFHYKTSNSAVPNMRKFLLATLREDKWLWGKWEHFPFLHSHFRALLLNYNSNQRTHTILIESQYSTHQLLCVSALTGLSSGSTQLYKAIVKLKNFFRFLGKDEFYSRYVQLCAPRWRVSEDRNV